MNYETADLRTRIFIPSNAFDILFGECNECAGAGIIPIPGSDKTCPCCRMKEKTKHCKKCNGTGISHE